MGNIIRVPGGNLHPEKGPSKKLECALRNYIDQHNVNIYGGETNQGIYKSSFRLKNGLCVHQEITVGSFDYVYRTALSYKPERGDQDMMTSLCILVNVLNCQIDYGNFEIDCNIGEVRYRTYLKPRDNIYDEDLSMLLGYPLEMIEKYGEALQEVLGIEER